MRLTDLLIKNLKAPEKGQKTYFDDGLPGFGVRVSQGGSKSFVVMYGKKRQLKTIGRYSNMKLADARAKAKGIQSAIAEDQEAAQGKLPTISFTSAREKFLTDCDTRTKPRTVEEYRRLLNRHFHYEKNLGSLTRSDIMDIVEQLRTTPSEQKHAFVAIRTMMNWCRKRGFIEASPVPPLSFTSQPRSRVLTEDELKKVWNRAAVVGYPYGRIVQLLILTGQRRGEIAGLRRSWITDDAVHFPQGFTKNKREHVVPIGNMAQEIIQSLPERTDLLFPSRLSDDTPFNGWSKSKRVFDKETTVPDYTLHDLRRTYSSMMAQLGVQIHVTERLLNHVSGTISGIAAVYNRHSYRDEMQDAVSVYENHLAAVFSEA